MALEDLTGDDKFLSALVPANPAGGDAQGEGDDHIRGIKNVLLNTFGAVDEPYDPDPMPTIRAAFVGMIAPFLPGLSPSLPPGWVLSRGQAIDSTTYPELVEFLNPGGTSATLPNLDGYFLRGWSADATVDPDGPRSPGSAQEDDFKSHVHDMPISAASNPYANVPYPYLQPGGSTLTGATGGAETRPKNVAVWWAIYAGR